MHYYIEAVVIWEVLHYSLLNEIRLKLDIVTFGTIASAAEVCGIRIEKLQIGTLVGISSGGQTRKLETSRIFGWFKRFRSIRRFINQFNWAGDKRYHELVI